MAEFSGDVALCYYCWVNRGWTPGQFEALSWREKLLVSEFAKRESRARADQAKGR